MKILKIEHIEYEDVITDNGTYRRYNDGSWYFYDICWLQLGSDCTKINELYEIYKDECSE